MRIEGSRLVNMSMNFKICHTQRFKALKMIKIGRYTHSKSLQSLYLMCLNSKFDALFEAIQFSPFDEMDYAFMQLYLARSCQWGHKRSVFHIWKKYVVTYNSLVVAPSILCQIGNMAIAESKFGVPNQLLAHFSKYHQHRLVNQEYFYELLRIKVEAFASTRRNAHFQEKWKVFLEDVDNVLNAGVVYKVRDFPNLSKSIEGITEDKINQLLFEEQQIPIQNSTSLTLLLNMILLQPNNIYSIEKKWLLFKRFYMSHKSLPFDDTIKLLRHQSKDSQMILSELETFLNENNSKKLDSQA